MRRLTRDKRQAVVGGVAAGIGESLELDPVLVRLAFVVLTLLHGLGIVVYVACWVSMPLEKGSAAESERVAAGAGATVAAAEPAEAAGTTSRPAAGQADRGRLLVGGLLIFVGIVSLVEELSPLDWLSWVRLSNLWPVILIATGAALLASARTGEP